MTNGNDAIEWIEKNEADLAIAFYESFDTDEIVTFLVENMQDNFDLFCHQQWAEEHGE